MFVKKKRAILFRKKLHFFLKPVLIIAFIFVIYQLIMFIQLTKDVNKEVNPNLILGTHRYQKQFYTPNNDKQFTCIVSMEIIDFKQINDNYCDCLDGSDEPGTNACANGQFFCTSQVDYMHYPKLVPSSKVNDGICDCCDGSDEWMHKKLLSRLTDELQNKLKRYQSPCPNLCNH